MRRIASLNLIIATVIGLATLAAPRSGRAEEVITVFLDQAKIIQLPEKTATVILGNPLIADLTMLKRNNKMILTGKGYGETNLIALDTGGNAIGESVVRVAAGEKTLTVQRGLDRDSYHCNPRCNPTVVLGDDAKYMGEAAGQISARNTASGPAAGR